MFWVVLHTHVDNANFRVCVDRMRNEAELSLISTGRNSSYLIFLHDLEAEVK